MKTDESGIFFNDEIKKEFNKDFIEKSITRSRVGLVLTILLFSLFGILDVWCAPKNLYTIWFIRYFIIIPPIALVLFCSFFDFYKKFMQILNSAVLLIGGLGIVAMIGFMNDQEPGSLLYYAGLILITMGIYTLYPLRIGYAVFTSCVVFASFEAVSLFKMLYIKKSITGFDFAVFLNNNYFFISANVTGIIALLTIVFFMRKEFMARIIIKSEKEKSENILSNIYQELELARSVQYSILPVSPPIIKNAKISVLYKPMQLIGGDLYDFIKFSEPHLTGIFISDVSGHGVPAALITTMVKAFLNSAGYEKLSPESLLCYLNKKIVDQISDNFLTAIYAIYDAVENKLVFSRGGHVYPVLVRNGTVTELISKGGFLGVEIDQKFEESHIQLESGDRVFFYTDGLTESRNQEGVFFESILLSNILPTFIKKDEGDIVQKIYQGLVSFTGDDNFHDDICIVVLEIF